MRAPGFLKRRFLSFRREAVLLGFAIRNPATPWYLKAASLLAGLYLISPIDLIPITVPFLGVLDDAIIVPTAVALITRSLPLAVAAEAGGKADVFVQRWFKRPLLAAALILGGLVVIWFAVLYLLYRLILG